MGYSVIIVTYNRLNKLKRCIECVLQQSKRASHIIIVNNCSSDGTKEYLEQFKNKQDFVIEHLKENSGGTGGFVRGLEIAHKMQDEWYTLIDDDAMLEQTYLERIDEIVMAKSNVWAFAGAVYEAGKISLFHRRNVKRGIKFIETDVLEEFYLKEYFPCMLASFCGLTINQKIIEQIGYPNKDFFIWYDDTEYSFRIGKVSQILVVPQARLNHEVAVPSLEYETTKRMKWKDYYGFRNKLFTIKEHSRVSLPYELIYQSLRAIKYHLVSLYSEGEVKDKFAYNHRVLKNAIRDFIFCKMGKNKDFMP